MSATFDVLAAALVDVTGIDAAAVHPATRLDGDLRLDSLEFAALAGRLCDRYGARVDLIGYVSVLDIDAIIALTVADVVAYLDSVGVR